jgi:hypothetical protein
MPYSKGLELRKPETGQNHRRFGGVESGTLFLPLLGRCKEIRQSIFGGDSLGGNGHLTPPLKMPACRVEVASRIGGGLGDGWHLAFASKWKTPARASQAGAGGGCCYLDARPVALGLRRPGVALRASELHSRIQRSHWRCAHRMRLGSSLRRP